MLDPKKKFDTIIREISDQLVSFSLVSEKDYELSVEYEYTQRDMLYQLEDTASTVVENRLFDSLPLRDYPYKKGLLEGEERKWKILASSSLGERPYRLPFPFAKETHKLRCYLLSDIGELAVVSARLKSLRPAKGFVPTTITPDENIELYISNDDITVTYSTDIEELSMENCLIEYRDDGVSLCKNMAAVMLEELGRVVKQAVEEKKRVAKKIQSRNI